MAFFWDTSQNFYFLGLKNLSPDPFLESPDSHRYNWILNFLLQLKNQSSKSKTVCDFSVILIFKGIMTISGQRVHGFCWTTI